ncbi:right-handed parallel beta-helix repeat-containing protein [Planktothricoides raciborskii]|nr:right-handed parallel beta-helix repeat-containing protein [Planktothricoides raciborskii]
MSLCVFVVKYAHNSLIEAMKTYFVSPDGNNNNPGSIAQPFQTIQKCADVAKPGDTCFIRKGIYRELVQPKNSGLPNAPIIFQAYNGEKVVISAARKLEGQWQEHENGIYKIKLDASWDLGVGQNQLFFDDLMMIEARWPNINRAVDLTRDRHIISSGGNFLGEAIASTKKDHYEASAYYKSSELKQFASGFWNDAYISFIPGHEWWGNVGTITQSTPGRVEFEFDFPMSWLNYHQPSGDDPFYIWGNYQALDAEQEWFFDTKGTQGEPYTLYFKPPGGTIENHTIELKNKAEIFQLGDRSHIHIKNIDFFGGSITMNANSYYNILEVITSQYAGHGHGFGRVYPAIKIEGNNHKLINSQVGKTAAEALQVRGKNHKIYNNVFHDSGYNSAISDGIQFYGDARDILFSNNTVFNSGGVGISATLKNSQIIYNHVWNIGRQKTDTAGINSWNGGDAEGTEIAYNLVHDVWAYLDNTQHNGGAGIRLDSGGSPLGNSNYKIHDNIVFNTSTRNSIAIWGLTPGNPNYGNAQIDVSNNTLDNSILLFDADGRSHAGTIVRNNLAVKHELVTTSKPKIPDGTTVEYNLFLNRVENNFAPIDAKLPRVKSLPSKFLPVLDSGEVFLPFTQASVQISDAANPIVGANYFLPGALITEPDLAKLKAIFNPQIPDKITLVNLPLGRILPETFRLKVGNANQSVNCVTLIENKGETTANCQINQANSPENQTISVSLDGNTFKAINLSIEVSPEKPPSTSMLFPPYSGAIGILVLGTIFITSISYYFRR